jgi:2-polyprenyl-3-methyl-5-hydroxy-6-metoxy-1,4-benzoquinol methylase
MDIYDPFYAKEKAYVGKKYDLITATEVIEHISDPLMYFRLFFELMKDDSVLAIMTLFHQNDRERFLNWHYIRDRTHVSFYTPKTIEYAAKKTGLKVIYTDNARYIALKKL